VTEAMRSWRSHSENFDIRSRPCERPQCWTRARQPKTPMDLARLPWVAATFAVASTLAAASAGAQMPEAVIYRPSTGAPLGAPVLVPLGVELRPQQSVSAATVVAGSISPEAPNCRLSLTTTVGAALVNGAVPVTIGAPALPCGGGRYTLKLRFTIAETNQPNAFVDRDATLWIRFEPAVEVKTAAAQPVELRAVQVLPYGPWWGDNFSPGSPGRVQTVEIENKSIGPVTVAAQMSAAGSTPGGALNDLVRLVEARSTRIPPGGRAVVQLESATTTPAEPGAYPVSLLISAMEEGPTEPLARVTAVPFKVNVRWPLIWALLAIVAGYFLGRAIGLLREPAFAEKLRVFDRINELQIFASSKLKDDALFQELTALAQELDLLAEVTPAFKAKLAELEKRVIDALKVAPADAALAALAPGGAQRPSTRVSTPTNPLVRSYAWFVGKPSVETAAGVTRPLVVLGIFAVGCWSGLQVNYFNQPTFGDDGVLDLMPLIIWSATTLAVASTLEGFKR
jgi:hypothetical protein